MMLLSQAAKALDGKLIGQDGLFNAVSSDSRTIAPGDLFVALKGDNFDGSEFIEKAIQSGAVAALAEEQGTKFMPLDSCPSILTPCLGTIGCILACAAHASCRGSDRQ